MSTQPVTNKNKKNNMSKNAREQNKKIEKYNFDASSTCTETLLEPLFQFVIFSDRFLIPLLLPPSPFNSSLSHTLRCKIYHLNVLQIYCILYIQQCVFDDY